MQEVVCGVIENAAGEFLACRRPAGKHLAGLWEFPGGKIDAGETMETALVRELWEELAVEVAVGAALTAVVWTYAEQTICLRPFYCEITGGELQARVHEQLRWCAPERFHELAWAAADGPVLQEIIASRSG